MRLPGQAMTADEFDDALAAAQRGIVYTDSGANGEISAALEAVAADAPSASDELVAAARAAFLRS